MLVQDLEMKSGMQGEITDRPPEVILPVPQVEDVAMVIANITGVGATRESVTLLLFSENGTCVNYAEHIEYAYQLMTAAILVTFEDGLVDVEMSRWSMSGSEIRFVANATGEERGRCTSVPLSNW
jgi:hypothetical protein